ncbi:Bug family tripartite tricarboxylate transporter substrate binding protein [Cupriavidus sp. D39]|uniref:Bug family tripartite tricarboxylate transporter substrate binding protein n=1 Tax=Cupriavidus sp. D39 TaxID=2997877 RepID=UPI00226F5548|nr:tripartite tricarboxylate transporter substrate-binding protein [Cupriavidus sp. D39]MCY0853518.1 tripartite tricarboxylate transporter substrate-binding protein [Cupriavidus sp. D39]
MQFQISRRALLAMGAGILLPQSLFAQPTGSRPIRLLVGFSAGSGADNVARLYAAHLTELLGVPVIVDNKPGASQLLAIRPMLAAQPDGLTLTLAGGSALSQGPGVRKDLPYDPLKDFSLIGMIATAPGVFFVHPSIPASSMRDLIVYAKGNPGKLNYGSAGVGSANHLQMEYIKKVTGIELTHIPYKSDQDVAREVVAGSVHVGLTLAQFAIPFAASGRLKAIAVTGSQRLSALPNVPSLAESGIEKLKGIDFTFYGLIGPAGMDPNLITKLNQAINRIGVNSAVSSQVRKLYCNPVQGSPADFRHYLETEVGKWRELGKTVKIESSA